MTATTDDNPAILFASVAALTRDGWWTTPERWTGTEPDLRCHLHGLLGQGYARVWATDATTGALLLGYDYDGRVLTTVPALPHGLYVDNPDDPKRPQLVHAPAAKIYKPAQGMTFRACRGFSSTVLVYLDGRCLGTADPQDLGYPGSGHMIAAGVAT